MAVVWSGACNFLGVYLGGVAVAYTIVNLLPVDLLVNINTNAGLGMVFALLLSAIIWNVGTWYLGLPRLQLAHPDRLDRGRRPDELPDFQRPAVR